MFIKIIITLKINNLINKTHYRSKRLTVLNVVQKNYELLTNIYFFTKLH
jgi:hypothetical protein